VKKSTHKVSRRPASDPVYDWVAALDEHPDLIDDLQQCRDALRKDVDTLSLLEPLLLQEALREFRYRSDPPWADILLRDSLSRIAAAVPAEQRVVNIGVVSVDWLCSRYFNIWFQSPYPAILLRYLVAAAICHGTWKAAYRFIQAAIEELTAAGAWICARVSDEEDARVWVRDDPAAPDTTVPALAGCVLARLGASKDAARPPSGVVAIRTRESRGLVSSPAGLPGPSKKEQGPRTVEGRWQ
jgi:hypothetical protein